jgi:uncharacterized protein affecting Mg2+/Co2+ transport
MLKVAKESQLPSVKISQLPSLATTVGSELFLVIQGTSSKKVSLATLFNGMKSSLDFDFNVQGNKLKVTNNGTVIFSAVGSTTNKVGIGTDDPQQQLHVYGSMQVGKNPVAVIPDTPTVSLVAAQSGVMVGQYNLKHDADGGLTITADNDTTLVSVTTDQTYILGAGTNGQEKTIIMWYSNNGAKAYIDPASTLGFDKVTLTSIGSSAKFKYVGGKWIVLSLHLASIVV